MNFHVSAAGCWNVTYLCAPCKGIAVGPARGSQRVLQWDQKMDVYIENALELWHGATLSDYAYVLAVIVAIAWLVSRNDR